jgi:CRP/FNR family transcriptional regulator, nitrogen fixation regulation protein
MNSSIHPPRTACGGPRRFEALRTLAVTTLYCRGQEICSQGEPADHWFWIIAGSARRSVIRSDGRRQIVDLLLPDDCFGFTNGAEYDDTVEAMVADTYAGSCSRRDAEAVADSNPELAREIRQATFGAMSRLQAQLAIVGRVTALEKVGGYLLEMSARTSSRSSAGLVLPMSRYDIADYLGLSVETVSRSLTHLKERRAIKLIGPRSVWILDRAALEGDVGPPHEDTSWKHVA